MKDYTNLKNNKYDCDTSVGPESVPEKVFATVVGIIVIGLLVLCIIGLFI